jgi:hypothetical protein
VPPETNTPTPARIGAHSFIRLRHWLGDRQQDSGDAQRVQAPGEANEGPIPLHIPFNIRTSYGPRLAGLVRPAIVIPSDPAAALAFARRIDREADHHLAEGRRELAERLAHAACEARFRAEGRLT